MIILPGLGVQFPLEPPILVIKTFSYSLPVHYYSFRALPVGGEAAKGWGRFAGSVQVVHGARCAALGHHLLVLVGGALERFPHVDVLQRH